MALVQPLMPLTSNTHLAQARSPFRVTFLSSPARATTTMATAMATANSVLIVHPPACVDRWVTRPRAGPPSSSIRNAAEYTRRCVVWQWAGQESAGDVQSPPEPPTPAEPPAMRRLPSLAALAALLCLFP